MMRAVASCLFVVATFAAATAQSPQPVQLTGNVSYTTIYKFDYTKDGHKNSVRFYIELKARPAVGKEGEPGYRAEEGYVHYYVYDVEKKQRVEKWLEGFGMLNHDAVAAHHPATNIAITGNTATFDALRMKWTVVVSGKGLDADSITVDDGFRKKPLKLYAGELRLEPAQ
jgi:hypothetical protein